MLELFSVTEKIKIAGYEDEQVELLLECSVFGRVR